MGDTNVGIVSCPSFFPFNSSTNKNTHYMRISAMLKLKKNSYLIISTEKFRIKQSKIEKKLFILFWFNFKIYKHCYCIALSYILLYPILDWGFLDILFFHLREFVLGSVWMLPFLKGKSKNTEILPGIFEKIKGNST